MTVQGMMPLIFLPGPARPRTAPARIASRVAHCGRQNLRDLIDGQR